MRVRLDAQGRPRPPVSPVRQQSSATPQPPPDVPPPQKPPRPPPAASLPVPAPVSNPLPLAPKPPLAQRTPPAHPAPPQRPLSASAAPPTPADDERASDSGSSAHNEGYNSEDEHPAARPELPARTQREREAAFVAQLAARGLRIIEMRPDGNCLFRALAHAVWNDAEKHTALRAAVMQYLLQERDYFSQFVAEDFVRYVRRKKRDGTHGNHLELQAAAELFGRPIEVYAYSSTPATVIEAWGSAAAADTSSTSEPIRLSFHRRSHYNALEPFNGLDKSAKRAAAEAAEQLAWRTAADAHATEDEIERAVMALSLVEASRAEHVAGSASSSTAAVPSSVLALINSGYSEESASEAYRVAGHGGLSEMIRYLTKGRFQHEQPSSTRQRRASAEKNMHLFSARVASESTQVANDLPYNSSETALTTDSDRDDCNSRTSEDAV
ncbi:OTU domain-containing protein 5 [Gracilariopsis chorda]|uniref:ubiquitinyl hydrolase 1 n=1 Tax=Gracilariopsis chorda TaxID=448386 RepID=A0A2V3IRA7_9FLOR|nr:OTU domain-containing protein 5 [Gracilariopsis chorda]|eukprot:PXF44633.1 OTU domain-containing protein 5 [Gracilariopsis chorda]